MVEEEEFEKGSVGLHVYRQFFLLLLGGWAGVLFFVFVGIVQRALESGELKKVIFFDFVNSHGNQRRCDMAGSVVGR